MKTIFDDLMELVDTNDAFFYKDFIKDGVTYRIFNYRLASYTNFLLPSAMECRGIMFEMDGDDYSRIASRPPEKFFNVNENPMTMDLDFDDPQEIMDKADGSLISTFMHKGNLGIKSKGSLSSDQALAVYAFLDKYENRILKNDLLDITNAGYTINMEWCAPDNRIVIGYETPQLIVLNVRDNLSGNYILLPTRFAGCWVKRFDFSEFAQTEEEFIKLIPDMNGREGFVIRLHNGLLVKMKTEWYVTQHRAKDSINSPRRLFEVVLEEATDDLRTLFHDDPLVIKQIEEMELFVDGLYNPLVKKVEAFYDINKDLTRKDYAILGQKTFVKKGEFGLVMNLYLGKEADVKGLLRKNYKHYGIVDEEPEDE